MIRIHLGHLSVLATCDTQEEAERASQAFERVLAPRFTRDEAIAIVRDALDEQRTTERHREHLAQGARLALDALAAAGVFWDGRNMSDRLDAAGIR